MKLDIKFFAALLFAVSFITACTLSSETTSISNSEATIPDVIYSQPTVIDTEEGVTGYLEGLRCMSDKIDYFACLKICEALEDENERNGCIVGVQFERDHTG